MSKRQATRQLAARLMGLGRLPADAVAYRLESGAVVDLGASSIRDLIAVAPSAEAVHEVLADTLSVACSRKTRRAWVSCAEARLAELRSEALVLA